MSVQATASFVNRDVELAFLEEYLAADVRDTRALVLQAPPGFGKSSLTDHFRILAEHPGRPFCIVDPLVLDTGTATRLHDGYFVQRCAETFDLVAGAGQCGWPSFEDYTRTNRWKDAAGTAGDDLLEAFLADETVRRPVFNYFARLFGLGRYAPAELLSSDSSIAVSRCTQYAVSILAGHDLILVVREAHLIDLYSLRTILEAVAGHRRAHLIFEYTTEQDIVPAHEKLFLRYPFMRLCPLPKMARQHLEHLLQTTVEEHMHLSEAAHAMWDGNLRAVQWLSSAPVALGNVIPLRLASRFASNLAEHLSSLSNPLKLVLATVHANAEPIPRHLLLGVLARTADGTLSSPEVLVDAALSEPGLLIEAGGSLRLDNESVAQAIVEAPQMKRFLALAGKILRDLYWSEIDRGAARPGEYTDSLRHIFRLSARTGDAAGLLHACAALDRRVAQSSDQTLYVDAVAAAVQAEPGLYKGDFDELLIWAASLAYETGDPRRAAELLEQLPTKDAFTLAMQAFALQEIGQHDASLRLARAISSDARTADEVLVAILIEALVVSCRGDKTRARTLLEDALADPSFQQSPLLGYAYRFHETIDGLLESLPRLTESAAWFEKFGLEMAKANSQFPAAICLARLGRTADAQALLAEAIAALEGKIGDKHVLLNNSAVLEMLGQEPDYISCVSLLLEALRFARDDFSELTILTNLALARMGAGDPASAAGSARQTMKILRDHDFSDRDIYWPICYNAAQVFDAVGDTQSRDAALRFPKAAGAPISVNRDYWAFRYGEIAAPPSPFEYLAGRPRHPVYLSHWLIEIEALRTLRRERTQ